MQLRKRTLLMHQTNKHNNQANNEVEVLRKCDDISVYRG